MTVQFLINRKHGCLFCWAGSGLVSAKYFWFDIYFTINCQKKIIVLGQLKSDLLNNYIPRNVDVSPAAGLKTIANKFYNMYIWKKYIYWVDHM